MDTEYKTTLRDILPLRAFVGVALTGIIYITFFALVLLAMGCSLQSEYPCGIKSADGSPPDEYVVPEQEYVERRVLGAVIGYLGTEYDEYGRSAFDLQPIVYWTQGAVIAPTWACVSQDGEVSPTQYGTGASCPTSGYARRVEQRAEGWFAFGCAKAVFVADRSAEQNDWTVRDSALAWELGKYWGAWLPVSPEQYTDFGSEYWGVIAAAAENL